MVRVEGCPSSQQLVLWILFTSVDDDGFLIDFLWVLGAMSWKFEV
jgi:hypothetical protein